MLDTQYSMCRCIKPWPNDRNMPAQHIATLLGATCCVRLATVLRCVAICRVLLAQVWKWSNLNQQHPTPRNMSQRGGQTHATCCAQQCCDTLRCHVAIVWPGLNIVEPALQAPAKRSQHLNATDHSIIARNMLHAFGHSFARCCNMLRVQNRASAYAQAQRCCTNMAKRQQHHTTFTNVAWKIWPFSNLSQQHPTPRNMSQQDGQTHATCCTQQCCDMLLWNVAIVWPRLYKHSSQG